MEIGDRIGDYEILGQLGRGGMGRVYRARNVISDRVEALKVLLPDTAGSPDFVARFLREIKVLATLDHPNIALLRTAFTFGDQVVMVMELVEGESLSKRLGRGSLSPENAIKYTQQVLAALEYAHQRHVIHRDIKPANMMVTPADVLKLTDFGIARAPNNHTLTATGSTTGSLAYMSPEQVNGETVDARSDLYSVGISLYEMVVGQTPFQASSEFKMMTAHLRETPTPPIERRRDLPPEMNRIILRAIAKGPEERFQSANEFRGALTSVTAGKAQTAGSASASAERSQSSLSGLPSSPTMLLAREGAAHRLLYVALGAALVVVAAAGTGIYLRRAEAGSGKAIVPAATETSSSAAEAANPPATATPAASEPSPASPPIVPDAAATAQPVDPASAEFAAALAPRPTPTQTDRSQAPRAPGLDARAKTAAAAVGKPAANTVVPAQETPAPPFAQSDNRSQQPTTKEPDELARLEQEVDQLAVRALTVNGTVQRLQQQQARQGVGLRGDMASWHAAMNLNLSKAAEALAQRDATRAQRYRKLAQDNLEALEKALGR